MKGFFDTELWKWIRTLIEVILIAAIFIGAFMFIQSNCRAERLQEEVWVLCNPESYVILRGGPGKRKGEIGGAVCGSVMWTDNVARNGFLHVTGLAAEEEDGWICARYIVYDEPAEVNREMVIRAQGRVACRKWVNGKIIRWLKTGDRVTVYWMSDSWAVTNRGYIRSEFLEEADGGE